MSLRLRLTLLNGLVLLLGIGAFAAVAYATQQQALQASLDGSLREQARWFSDNASTWYDRGTGRPRGVTLPNPQRFTAPDVFIQITARDGEVVARSPNLDEESLPSSPELLQRALAGEEWFSDVELDGQLLRRFVAPLRVAGPGEGATTVGMIQVARPLAPLRNNLRTLETTFLTVGAAGVLASLGAGWLLARAALRPIDRLAATAQAIGTARDFSRRVPLRPGVRRDEVGRLAEEFNRMLAQLQAAYEQLEAALTAQRRFVADASHELRTPLTSLRGNVDLLRRMVAAGPSSADPEEQELLLADLAAETERLARLVNDLLLLARADAGQHLTLVPTEVGALVRDAFRAARFLREDVTLALDAVPAGLWVAGDADRLKQLLLILLDNALKYSPAGARVTLAAEPLARTDGVPQRDPGRAGEPVPGVALRVTDSGPGIPPEEQPRIFERFYRADRARRAGGSGLGLSIARWIVEEHGGTIAVASAPGQGSTFTVWLPTIPPPASAGAERSEADARAPAPVG